MKGRRVLLEYMNTTFWSVACLNAAYMYMCVLVYVHIACVRVCLRIGPWCELVRVCVCVSTQAHSIHPD